MTYLLVIHSSSLEDSYPRFLGLEILFIKKEEFIEVSGSVFFLCHRRGTGLVYLFLSFSSSLFDMLIIHFFGS
jgi:hypothetical protein